MEAINRENQEERCIQQRARVVYDLLKGTDGGRGSDRCLLVAFAWELVSDWIARAAFASAGEIVTEAMMELAGAATPPVKNTSLSELCDSIGLDVVLRSSDAGTNASASGNGVKACLCDLCVILMASRTETSVFVRPDLLCPVASPADLGDPSERYRAEGLRWAVTQQLKVIGQATPSGVPSIETSSFGRTADVNVLADPYHAIPSLAGKSRPGWMRSMRPTTKFSDTASVLADRVRLVARQILQPARHSPSTNPGEFVVMHPVLRFLRLQWHLTNASLPNDDGQVQVHGFPPSSVAAIAPMSLQMRQVSVRSLSFTLLSHLAYDGVRPARTAMVVERALLSLRDFETGAQQLAKSSSQILKMMKVQEEAAAAMPSLSTGGLPHMTTTSQVQQDRKAHAVYTRAGTFRQILLQSDATRGAPDRTHGRRSTGSGGRTRGARGKRKGKKKPALSNDSIPMKGQAKAPNSAPAIAATSSDTHPSRASLVPSAADVGRMRSVARPGEIEAVLAILDNPFQGGLDRMCSSGAIDAATLLVLSAVLVHELGSQVKRNPLVGPSRVKSSASRPAMPAVKGGGKDGNAGEPARRRRNGAEHAGQATMPVGIRQQTATWRLERSFLLELLLMGAMNPSVGDQPMQLPGAAGRIRLLGLLWPLASIHTQIVPTMIAEGDRRSGPRTGLLRHGNPHVTHKAVAGGPQNDAPRRTAAVVHSSSMVTSEARGAKDRSGGSSSNGGTWRMLRSRLMEAEALLLLPPESLRSGLASSPKEQMQRAATGRQVTEALRYALSAAPATDEMAIVRAALWLNESQSQLQQQREESMESESLGGPIRKETTPLSASIEKPAVHALEPSKLLSVFMGHWLPMTPTVSLRQVSAPPTEADGPTPTAGTGQHDTLPHSASDGTGETHGHEAEGSLHFPSQASILHGTDDTIRQHSLYSQGMRQITQRNDGGQARARSGPLDSRRHRSRLGESLPQMHGVAAAASMRMNMGMNMRGAGRYFGITPGEVRASPGNGAPYARPFALVGGIQGAPGGSFSGPAMLPLQPFLRSPSSSAPAHLGMPWQASQLGGVGVGRPSVVPGIDSPSMVPPTEIASTLKFAPDATAISTPSLAAGGVLVDLNQAHSQRDDENAEGSSVTSMPVTARIGYLTNREKPASDAAIAKPSGALGEGTCLPNQFDQQPDLAYVHLHSDSVDPDPSPISQSLDGPALSDSTATLAGATFTTIYGATNAGSVRIGSAIENGPRGRGQGLGIGFGLSVLGESGLGGTSDRSSSLLGMAGLVPGSNAGGTVRNAGNSCQHQLQQHGGDISSMKVIDAGTERGRGGGSDWGDGQGWSLGKEPMGHGQSFSESSKMHRAPSHTLTSGRAGAGDVLLQAAKASPGSVPTEPPADDGSFAFGEQVPSAEWLSQTPNSLDRMCITLTSCRKYGTHNSSGL